MKKKYLAAALLLAGVTLFCVSIIVTIIETGGKNIIGGADIHTFFFVFFHSNRGLCFYLSVLGILSVIASFVLNRTPKQ